MSLTRQLVFGVALDIRKVYGEADRHLGQTLSWAQVDDYNSTGKSFTCGYVPTAKGDSAGVFQESLFLGAIGAGKMLRTLVAGKTQDGAETITAEAIPNRLDPSLAEAAKVTEPKRFDAVEFPSVNPLANGLTVQVCFDIEDPTKDVVSWDSVVNPSLKAKSTIRNGLGRWMHMRLLDTTLVTGKVVFNSFKLWFYDLAGTEDGNS